MTEGKRRKEEGEESAGTSQDIADTLLKGTVRFRR